MNREINEARQWGVISVFGLTIIISRKLVPAGTMHNPGWKWGRWRPCSIADRFRVLDHLRQLDYPQSMHAQAR